MQWPKLSSTVSSSVIRYSCIPEWGCQPEYVFAVRRHSGHVEHLDSKGLRLPDRVSASILEKLPLPPHAPYGSP